MRKGSKIIAIASLTALLLSTGLTVSATDQRGYETTPLPEETYNRVKSTQITKLTEEPEKDLIECFAVNSDGMIALCTKNYVKDTIAVYSSEGVFQYGYTFFQNGSIEIDWLKNGGLVFYDNRSDIAHYLDRDGNLVDFRKIPQTEANLAYERELNSRKKIVLGDRTYAVRSRLRFLDSGLERHPMLVIIEADGTEKVIYDATSNTILHGILSFIIVSIVGSLMTLYILRGRRKKAVKKAEETTFDDAG